MNTELLLTALGALLVLTAIVGGGLEVREFKIPKIGRVARAAAGLSGLVCIFLAIGLASVATEDTPGGGPMVINNIPKPAEASAAETRPLKLRLHDELAGDQLTEQVDVVFDGRHVGDIKVNADFPTGMIELTVPKAGSYDYTLQSTTEELLDDGSTIVVAGSGQGHVSVGGDADFDVQFADSGTARNVTLVSR
jgi:hypothetical protein